MNEIDLTDLTPQQVAEIKLTGGLTINGERYEVHPCIEVTVTRQDGTVETIEERADISERRR